MFLPSFGMFLPLCSSGFGLIAAVLGFAQEGTCFLLALSRDGGLVGSQTVTIDEQERWRLNLWMTLGHSHLAF